MQSKKIFFAFLFLALVWGASFIFMRVGAPEFSAPVFGGLRCLIAAIVLLPMLMRGKHLLEFKTYWIRLSLIGFLSMGLPFMLLSFSAYEINAGTSAVINSSVPMITGFIAHFFFQDKLVKAQVLGLSIGILGVVLLMFDTLTHGGHTSILAFCLAISACFCYAIGGNLTKRYLAGISPMVIASSGLLASGVGLLPLIIIFFPEHDVSRHAWWSVLSIALLSTAVAMIVFYWLIHTLGPTKTTSVTLLVPVVSIVLGYVFLQEKLTPFMFVGACVVLLGTSLTLFSKKAT